MVASPPSFAAHMSLVKDMRSSPLSGLINSKMVCYYEDLMNSIERTSASGHPRGDRILAIGDSITLGVPYVPPDATFPAFLQDMTGKEVINIGVGGLTLAEMEMGFDANVEEHDPSLVIIEGGINDIEYGRSSEEVIGDLASILRKAHQKKIPIAVCTLLPASLDAGSDESRVEVNVWIRRLSDKERILVDIDIELRDSIQSDQLSYMYDSGDHAHPNLEGMKRIAKSISSAIQAK
ncbi:MAG: multifunctional acyl-CoA thioesterase I and protease I and lysophospholipase L1 [Methanomassiliicoccales archaeon PtaU1.Bin124]|nr:MAG: multifunctional acyl-CoA thioesterase I and protease I and lysophospholipase L1 [Methanomassiliicoccales archaeon PtaU1.Bin124]